MIRVHPQWLRTREIVQSGEIGVLRTMHRVFGYLQRRDAANIRNRPECGGGALMDIGCYPDSRGAADLRRRTAACECAGSSGIRTSAPITRFPDRWISPTASALFTTSTQMNPYQRVGFFVGRRATWRSRSPFNAPCPTAKRRILVRGHGGSARRRFRFAISIRCRAMPLQGRFWKMAARCRCRSEDLARQHDRERKRCWQPANFLFT